MRKIIEKIITLIITLLIIIIFLATVYFCLDVFGIVNVPEKYSIANLLYSQFEKMVQGINTEEIISVGDINTEKIIVREDENNDDKDLSNVQNPLDELKNSQTANNNDYSTTSINSNRFYYSQLNEYGKKLYDRLYEHKEELKTGTYTVDYGLEFNDILQEEEGEQILKDALDSAINSLILDNPDIFYVDISRMYLLTNITQKVFSTTYKVSIGGHGNSYLEENFQSTEEVNTAINDVQNIKNEIINKVRNLDEVKQIEFVHDYLIDNTEYDLNAGATIYNAYGSLIDKRAVCEGYAKAFKYILDDLEIPCIIVCGTGTNSANLTESHAWNYVFVKGKWYAVDVTWDDPIISGFLPGGLPDNVRYANFLKGSNEFFGNHVEDEFLLGNVRLLYPEISVEDY